MRRVKDARLVLREADYLALRQALLQEDHREAAALFFLGHHQSRDFLELYGQRLLIPQRGDYAHQDPAAVELQPQYMLGVFSAFAQSQAFGLLHAHSHPFSGHASFSPVDDRYLPQVAPSLARYLGLVGRPREFVYGRLVVGQEEEGFQADCWSPEGRCVARIREIRVVGPSGVRSLRRETPSTLPSFLRSQLDRNIRVLGEEGQKRLVHTHLGVCGLGGLGSLVLFYARGLGFRRFTLVDPDRVEASNLNRLWGAAPADLGQPKVEVLRRELLRFDPNLEVHALAERVQTPKAREALLQADVLVGCVDDDAARLELQILAARYLKPLMDLGAGILLDPEGRVREMGGQIVFYFPGGPCLLCQGLDPHRISSPPIAQLHRALGYVPDFPDTPTAVVTLNAVVAGMAMDLLTRYLTGFSLVPRYLKVDLLRFTAAEMRFVPRPSCPICGSQGVEGQGDEQAQPLPPPERKRRRWPFSLRRKR